MRLSFAWPALVLALVACGQIFVGVDPDASLDASRPVEDAPREPPDAVAPDSSDARAEPADALPTNDAPTPLRFRVFVTSDVFDGSPGAGGRGAADAVCGIAGARLVGSRRWMAYLAVPGSHAASRFDDVGEWVLVDGRTPVTPNRGALLMGVPLQNAINVTETGMPLAAGDSDQTWTGMSNNTPAATNHCGQWANGSFNVSARIGNARQTDVTWQSTDNALCSNKHRFYCFEQP